jgi:hypothetical protein
MKRFKFTVSGPTLVSVRFRSRTEYLTTLARLTTWWES